MQFSNDKARLALRPQLDLAPASAPDEKFQNDTLRPVLKLQHALILAVFQAFLAKRKVSLDQLPAAQRSAKIKDFLTRDHRLRDRLFGLALGQFTLPEMEVYLANESTLNRRLTNLLVERLVSAFVTK